ncbi:hypothetical protein Pint_33493 [Pistacia integerrima]|uniref:Uncharacterized protein n=1 Tax=Pistacia integerrima TaxID=434235 RepID=A0ACC0X5T5_9ROSI|nr:hypothetical protein Pint_33493 [Pistacia integerrima]
MVTTHFYHHAQRRRFENLMRLIESSCPSLLLRRKEIERHFSKLTHIPDHPPYAYMIQRAITELNELGGSSEVTISKFIEAEYEDLPFAHASLLTHHLQKLVKKGDIVCTSGNCYILTNESSDFRCNLNKEQKHLRRRCQKGRQHKVKGVESQKQKKIEESQEKTQVNGTICKGIEEQKPVEGHIGPTGEQENKGYAELIEKHNEVEEIQFKVNDEQVEAEQYNEGIDEHNQKQEQQKQQQKEMNLQQIQVLGKTSEVLVEENSQAEDRNQAESHTGVAEAEHLKELDKEVMEEQFHEEQKSEKLEEKNKIQDQESKASKKQVQLPEIQIEGVVERINPKFSGEANIFEPKAGQSYLVGLIEHFHKLRRGSPEKPPESKQVTSSLNVLQELSLEHQHQTTFSNVAKVLEYKQPPENSMEGSLTEQELTAVEPQLQPQRQMPSDRTPGDQLNTGGKCKNEDQRHWLTQQTEQQKNRCGQKKRLISWPKETAVDSTITSAPQTKDQLQQRQLHPRGQGPSQSEIKQKTREPYPLKLQQHGKEQPKSRGRGRPPKLKTNVDTNLVGSLVIGHQSHNEEQPKHRERGRPPKSRLSTSMDSSLPPQHQCNVSKQTKKKKKRRRQQQLKSRGQGSPKTIGKHFLIEERISRANAASALEAFVP